jgi:hypothetical protein
VIQNSGEMSEKSHWTNFSAPLVLNSSLFYDRPELLQDLSNMVRKNQSQSPWHFGSNIKIHSL